MAADTTILNTDVDVYYLSNNRGKLMHWNGTATNPTYTMNELYSAMATLLDEETTIDDGSAFSAETPVEYTTGKIDAGDNDPWYVSFELMEHITGGALRTSGWARVEGTNTGIVVVPVVRAGLTITNADIGKDIVTDTDNDAGTLLEVINDGVSTNAYLVVRPDDDTAGNSFDNSVTAGDGLTCNTNTGTQAAASLTGDMIWANIYSIGTVEASVHMYVYQGAQLTVDSSTRVFSVNSTTVDYWANGHIDMCVPIKDYKTAAFPSIDAGYLRVFARKGGDLYASFEVSNSTTSGGRNPVPLQTAVDLDQDHGTSVISFVGAVSGTFEDGEVIRQTTGTNTGAQGILDLTNSTVTSGGELVYFAIAENDVGGQLLAFESGVTITGQTSTASVTTDGAPAADGPANSTWFTNSGTPPDLQIGNATADIDNNTVNEYYGVTIDCNQNPLSEVYQWAKWICQYGQGDTDMVEQAFSDDLSQDGVYGEEYEGGTTYIAYTGGTTPTNIAEGESVTQLTTGATGVVISHDSTNMVALIRNTRSGSGGSFASGYTVEADDDSSTWTTVTAANFAPKTAAPLGTFAGGTFFGARGILLTDYLATDSNSFILTDIPGATRERPTSITIEVTNLEGTDETTDTDDIVAIFKLTGSNGDVEKDSGDAMLCDSGEAIGDATLAVDTIPTWVPDAGRIILRDISNSNKEYVLRYSSHASNVYTLANIDLTTITGATTTTLTETGAFTNAKRGDLVLNKSRSNAISYIKTVDSNDSVTIDPAIAAQTNGDNVEINAVPITPAADDEVYNAIMHRFAANTEESVGIIYPGSTLYFRVKVRNTRSSTEKIKPYSSDGSTSGTDQSIPVVRTEDTIIT